MMIEPNKVYLHTQSFTELLWTVCGSAHVYVSRCLQSSVFLITHFDLVLSPITLPIQSLGWLQSKMIQYIQ